MLYYTLCVALIQGIGSRVKCKPRTGSIELKSYRVAASPRISFEETICKKRAGLLQ